MAIEYTRSSKSAIICMTSSPPSRAWAALIVAVTFCAARWWFSRRAVTQPQRPRSPPWMCGSRQHWWVQMCRSKPAVHARPKQQEERPTGVVEAQQCSSGAGDKQQQQEQKERERRPQTRLITTTEKCRVGGGAVTVGSAGECSCSKAVSTTPIAVSCSKIDQSVVPISAASQLF